LDTPEDAELNRLREAGLVELTSARRAVDQQPAAVLSVLTLVTQLPEGRVWQALNTECGHLSGLPLSVKQILQIR